MTQPLDTVESLLQAMEHYALEIRQKDQEIERLRAWVERLLAEHNTYHGYCSVYSPSLERQS